MAFSPGRWLGMGRFITRCSRNFLVLVLSLAGTAAMAQGPMYQRGRPAREEEIRAWDISIGPEGKELPPGSGSAKEGVAIYAQKCAACHGKTGAETRADHLAHMGGAPGPLVGGIGTLHTTEPLKTVGSFWPYATMIWDYINRGMPEFKPGTLTANEVYSVTAFLLFQNGLIKETDVIDSKSLPQVRMPNRDGFVPTKPEWKPGIRRPLGYYP